MFHQSHKHLHGFIAIKDSGKPACSTGGFPTLRRGSLSNYVLIAQDDLNTLGFRTGGLDGIFGSATQNAVISYQRMSILLTFLIQTPNKLTIFVEDCLVNLLSTHLASCLSCMVLEYCHHLQPSLEGNCQSSMSSSSSSSSSHPRSSPISLTSSSDIR